MPPGLHAAFQNSRGLNTIDASSLHGRSDRQLPLLLGCPFSRRSASVRVCPMEPLEDPGSNVTFPQAKIRLSAIGHLNGDPARAW